MPRSRDQTLVRPPSDDTIVSPAEQASELLSAISSFTDFLENVWVDDPNDPGRGVFKWQMWPHLKDLIDTFIIHRLIIILKARQIGVSWILAAYALWTAMYFPHSVVLLMSQGEDEAKELLDKCRRIYNRLPRHLQTHRGKDNDELMEFPKIESMIVAEPSTARAGRSYTATLVIADEWAFHPYAAENYSAIYPTINAPGSKAQFIGCSTANGMGNFFHLMYGDAKKQLTNFAARFYDTFQRPGRDKVWYEETRRNFKSLPHLFHQEYPTDDEEAFILTAGIPFFDAGVLEQLRRLIAPPLRVVEIKSLAGVTSGHLYIWEEAVPSRRYVCGADPAWGFESSHDAAAAFLDWKSGNHVASLVGQFPPDVFGDEVVKVCKDYRDAYLGPESQGPVGTHFVNRIIDLGYDSTNQLYYDDFEESYRRGRQPDKPGFPMAANRGTTLGEFEEAVRYGQFTTKDEFTLSEMGTFVIEKRKPQAAPGTQDNRVLCASIAWQMKQFARFTQTPTRGRSFLVPR